MKSKLLLIAFLLCTALSAVPLIDENTYLVKPGDKFLIEVVTIDTVQVVSPVLPEGRLSLHPVGPSIQVAGLTLSTVKKMALAEIEKRCPQSLIAVELSEAAPVRFQLTGAVRAPGEHDSPSLPTLSEALNVGKGLLPQASRKVTVIRGSTKTVYDTKKYLLDGDVSQNPFIQDGDRIDACFAENYLRISAFNDTTLASEYYEIDQPQTIREVLLSNLVRYHSTQYSSIRVIRNDQMLNANLDFIVQAGDSIYLASEENYVYVLGYVLRPGRFVYNGPRDYMYYINLAGGFSTTGSQKRIKIVGSDGVERDMNTPLRPGDTIRVPEASWYLFRDYLSPVSVLATIVYYIWLTVR
jgi:protein involved in polysaccharide export with SLBB domain